MSILIVLLEFICFWLSGVMPLLPQSFSSAL
jgi:hypothetical protein